ncbi:MAG: hemolysin family protein [Spirochaetaceae bacterium]|nr:hemolysin family protein [Spirochaetaceae bacterium]
MGILRRLMSILDRLLRKPSDEERRLDDLGPHAREMIDGVVQLSSTTVKDIMVPRPDVVFVSVDATPEELMETITESGHSRLPVYHKTVDDVIGVLYAKDLLGQIVGNGRNDDRVVNDDSVVNAGKAMRKPYFVPESKRVDELLHEFQRRRVHLAIVTDEYGGTSGIACMEDVLEEIVGDIQDEFDNESEEVLKLGAGVYLCDARVSLDELEDHGLALELPVDEFNTLGGFVFDLFGKIPVIYETKRYGEADFVIQGMDGRRITRVKIVLRSDPEDESQQDRSA